MALHRLDARGLICPLPVLKARKKLLSLHAGDELEVTVTDPIAPEDFELFCAESGYIIVSSTAENGVFIVKIRIG